MTKKSDWSQEKSVSFGSLSLVLSSGIGPFAYEAAPSGAETSGISSSPGVVEFEAGEAPRVEAHALSLQIVLPVPEPRLAGAAVQGHVRREWLEGILQEKLDDDVVLAPCIGLPRRHGDQRLRRRLEKVLGGARIFRALAADILPEGDLLGFLGPPLFAGGEKFQEAGIETQQVLVGEFRALFESSQRLRNVAETGEARQLERDKSLAPGESDGGVRRRDQLMESRLGREIAPLVEDRGSPHRVEDVPVEAGEESVSVLPGNSLPDDPELDPVRSFPVPLDDLVS